jgi:hypothetical protein
MYSNLPPNIQDWLTQLKNKKIPMNIRFNYFSMLTNVVDQVQPEVQKFQKEMDNQHK